MDHSQHLKYTVYTETIHTKLIGIGNISLSHLLGSLCMTTIIVLYRLSADTAALFIGLSTYDS